MPLFKPLKINNGDYLYREMDYSDEVYFITRGRVNFVVKGSEIVYKSYLRGSYIGEIEVIRKIPRLNNAICYGECEFLVLMKKDFMEILEEFPNEKREVVRVANERARRNKQSLWETTQLVQLKAKKGNIGDLAGHDRVLEETEDLINPLEDTNSSK
jgi:CRP-like cAMP-binding protein